MFTVFLQRFTSLAIWGTVCTAFSVFTSSGVFIFSGAILAVLTGIIAVMLGPQFIAASWLIGSPTLFGFPNQLLRVLPFVTMERLLLAVLIVMVFLRHAFSKRQVSWIPLEITILVFLIYACANMAFHTEADTVKRDGWLWVQYLLPMTSFIISRRIEWTDQGLRMLLAALTFTGVFVAIIGILQSLFGINIFTMNYQTITAGHGTRAYGTFSSAHTYVATLSIFLIVSLLQHSVYRDALARTALLAAMTVIAVGIVLGATRGPLIGAALGLVVIFVKHPQARPLMLVGGVAALFAGLVFALVMFDYLDYFIQRFTNIRTLEGRAAAWATALNMLADHPLFGVGFRADSYLSHKFEYQTGIGSLTAQYAEHHAVPHNEYLHVSVLLGITGLVLFLMILMGVVKLMFRIFNDESEDSLRRHLALYAGAIFIALMFNSFFSDTYVQDYFWIVAFFLAGLAAGNLDTRSRRASVDSLENRENEPASQ